MKESELRERVLAAVQREPSLSRPATAAREAWRLGGALLVTLAVFAACRGVRIGDRPLSLVVATALGALSIGIAVAAAALGRGGSMLGRRRALLWTVAIVTPLALLSWKLAWTAGYDALGPTRLGLKCLILSLATAAAPMAVLLVARHGDPLNPAATGAAVGAAVGTLAWLLVDLWCPVGRVAHLLVGHVLPVVLLIVFGAFFGRRYLALR